MVSCMLAKLQRLASLYNLHMVPPAREMIFTRDLHLELIALETQHNGCEDCKLRRRFCRERERISNLRHARKRVTPERFGAYSAKLYSVTGSARIHTGPTLYYALTSARDHLRQWRGTHRLTHGRIDGCVTIPGYGRVLMRDVKRVKKHAVYQGKKPVTSEPHVGIEIECGIDTDHDGLAQLLSDQAVALRSQIHGDGSVEVPERCTAEVVLLATERDYAEVIRKACAAISDASGKVNSTCGLHVHVDCRPETGRDPKAIYRKLVAAQPWLYAVVSPSRRSGDWASTYCARSTWRHAQSRYRAINWQSFSRHKTIEVRLHHGSVEADKITNWVRLILSVVNGPVVRADRIPKDAYEAAKLFRWDLDLLAWVDARARKLGGAEAEGLSLPGQPLAMTLRQARALAGE